MRRSLRSLSHPPLNGSIVSQTGFEMSDDNLRFAVLAEKDGDSGALVLHSLTMEKLYEHIVVPYEEDRPFFIDGVPVERKNLRRIKIIRQDDEFALEFDRLHNGIKNPKGATWHVPIAEYPGRLVALFRERNLDVTSDVIEAYRGRKKLKIPTEKLIEAASQIAVAAIRTAG